MDGNSVSFDEFEDTTFPLRRSARVQPTIFAASFVTHLESEVKTPATVQEAPKGQEKVQWQAAMDAQMNCLQD